MSQVQRHINAKISGDPAVGWLERTLRSHFADRVPLGHCLSLGCGMGHLERSLAHLGAFQHCDAYDLSEHSIHRARELASREGFDTIAYHVADVNTLVLPSLAYDAVWVSGAMHHFQALEHVSVQVCRTLKPGGLLILNEYIGPARFQFPLRQKQIADACLQLLPERYRALLPKAIEMETSRSPLNKGLSWSVKRVIDKVKERDLVGVIRRRMRAYRARSRSASLVKTTIEFPFASSVATLDPSEAVRSDEMLQVLERDFEIVERKDLGGNILQFLLAGIAGNFSDDDDCAVQLVDMLFTVEDVLIKCGELESDFVYIVARPRSVQ